MNRRGFMGMLAGLPGCAWLISKGIEDPPASFPYAPDRDAWTHSASTESGFIDGRGVFRDGSEFIIKERI